MRENEFLQDVTRLTLADSIHCIRLSLWDEVSQRLISFRDARSTDKSAENVA